MCQIPVAAQDVVGRTARAVSVPRPATADQICRLKRIERVIQPAIRQPGRGPQFLLAWETGSLRIPLGIVRIAEVEQHPEGARADSLGRDRRQPMRCLVAHFPKFPTRILLEHV